ncbi:hypothetical protein [Deinococcus sp. Leaf326]|uniref:hypothetical protein n=1 Tax=Deinococcus sp. Leaf326 TaxID=1736338 RepID=UPI0006F779CD|nr:hypothetical protein [Deinococcus sp. Leaf326]KQR40724.1 hypothetical protein ASF71_00725 [Deinococcus sp. Leaf326]
MPRPDLEAARALALTVLGRGAHSTLDKLEAAGLVIVKQTDLPRVDGRIEDLENVRATIPANWSEPWPVTVVTAEGERLTLYALHARHEYIGEALHLHAVMGMRLDLTVNRAEELVLDASAVQQ